MALPKLNTPTYELEVPSTDEKIQYRPFLVKEEKLLMIAMESNDKTDEYRECFPCITAVRPNTELQTQCDRQSLDSFKAYKPEMAFPRLLG